MPTPDLPEQQQGWPKRAIVLITGIQAAGKSTLASDSQSGFLVQRICVAIPTAGW